MSKALLHLLTLFLSFVSLTSNGQETHDGCGIDKDPKLNQCELEFFDSFFDDEGFKKKNYDFRDKKFAFISGAQLLDKDEFFKLVSNYRGPKGFNFFTSELRTRTGYDGIVLINLKAYNLDDMARIIEKQKDK